MVPNSRPGFAPFDYLLYGLVVLIWGTSWVAIHMQYGLVAPEVSLVWRFVIAAGVMMAWVVATGRNIRFSFRDHLRFAGLGLSMFSTNFVLFYYAGLSTPSGLLAVVFSLASIFNMVLGVILFAQRPAPRTLVAAFFGFLGVVALFWPQVAKTGLGLAGFQGLLMCAAGTLCFCMGNMLSVSNQKRGLPIASSTAWGMTYGAGLLLAFSLMRDQTFQIEWTPRYLVSLLWLALVASIGAFTAYILLLRRIGADRAGYSTVLYPVLALGLSVVTEGYVIQPIAMAGLALVLFGNALMLTGGKFPRAKTIEAAKSNVPEATSCNLPVT